MLWHLGHMKASSEGEGRVSEEERDQRASELMGEWAKSKREREVLAYVDKPRWAGPSKK